MTDFARVNEMRQAVHAVRMQLVNDGNIELAALLSDPIDGLDDLLAEIVRAPLVEHDAQMKRLESFMSGSGIERFLKDLNASSRAEGMAPMEKLS